MDRSLQAWDSKFRMEGENRGESSVFTLMIWLNEEYEGGETHLLPCKLQGEDIYIKGNTGDALIFWQRGMLHEGTETTAGSKYIVHTNVMYSPHVGDGPRPTPQRFRYAKSIRKQQREMIKAAYEEHGVYATKEQYEENAEKYFASRRDHEEKYFPVTVES